MDRDETPRQKVIRMLWEKQFEKSPWHDKFHLMRPDSLEADYGKLADEIIGAITPERRSQAENKPQIDRGELIAMLLDLTSVNMTPEAGERQARRMADALIRKLAAQPANSGQAILQHCDELHDLGFKAGWDAALQSPPMNNEAVITRLLERLNHNPTIDAYREAVREFRAAVSREEST